MTEYNLVVTDWRNQKLTKYLSPSKEEIIDHFIETLEKINIDTVIILGIGPEVTLTVSYKVDLKTDHLDRIVTRKHTICVEINKPEGPVVYTENLAFKYLDNLIKTKEV